MDTLRMVVVAAAFCVAACSGKSPDVPAPGGQWDRDRFEPMALDDLSRQLPEFEPQLIEQALEEARSAGRVAASGDGRFRLVPNH